MPVCLDLLIVPFCHHKFEHHFIASTFFIYRRTLCYRAIQKNVQHKVLEFLKLARLARWLNIFTLVRGLFQSDPIIIMRACFRVIACHCVIVCSIQDIQGRQTLKQKNCSTACLKKGLSCSIVFLWVQAVSFLRLFLLRIPSSAKGCIV